MIGAIDLGWTVGEVAEVVGGTLTGPSDGSVRFVTTDSRDDVAGAAFVALRGERFDGHDFVEDVVADGAAVAIVDERRGPGSQIVVADTQAALLALATRRRSELDLPVVAITGSSGKTSTKDLLAGAVPGSWASPRSFNNEIGVPLTVLGTPSDASALVIEVGSRGPGHIAALAPAIRPDVAIITNLGVAHLEMFGSEPVLADAKYELLAMVGPRGVRIIPADEPRVARGGPGTTVTFGVDDGDVAARDVVVDANGFPSFALDVAGRLVQVDLSVAGAFQAHNAAAAAAAAHAIGVDLDTVVTGLSHATGSDWRMDVHRGSYTVVNDAYNANPASMRSALDAVAAMHGVRHIAVLGPMQELGTISREAHRAIGAHAAASGFAPIIVVGEDPGYALGAGDLVVNATGLPEAADTLRAVVEPGDVVLVKASRASGLERLAIDLAEEAAT